MRLTVNQDKTESYRHDTPMPRWPSSLGSGPQHQLHGCNSYLRLQESKSKQLGTRLLSVVCREASVAATVLSANIEGWPSWSKALV